MEGFHTVLDVEVKKIVAKLADLYSFDEDAALKLLYEDEKIAPVQKTSQVVSQKDATTQVVKVNNVELTLEVSSSKTNPCQFEMTSGKNKGNECGVKTCYKYNGKWYHGTVTREDNGEYKITAHLNSVLSAETKKATKKPQPLDSNGMPNLRKPKTLKQAKENASAKSKSLIEKVVLDTAKRRVRLDKEKGIYWEPISGLVFDRESQKAIGHYNLKSGKTESLSEEDIAVCEEHGFKFVGIEQKRPPPKAEEDEVAEDEAEEEEDEVEVDED